MIDAAAAADMGYSTTTTNITVPSNADATTTNSATATTTAVDRQGAIGAYCLDIQPLDQAHPRPVCYQDQQHQESATRHQPSHLQDHFREGGAAGFHSNAWGQPFPRSSFPHCYIEGKTTFTSPTAFDQQKCGRSHYEDSARSFSAAAAVAAVAAAYINSSSSSSTSTANCFPSRHSNDDRYAYDNDPQSERSRPYRPSFWLPDAYGNLQAFEGQHSKAVMEAQPEAHSFNVHPLTGLGEICQDPTGQPRSFPFYNDRPSNPRPPSQIPHYPDKNSQHNSIPCLCEDAPASSSEVNVPSGTTSSRPTKVEKPPTHVKKPLNAFMLFMKEMRAKVVAECTMKESAAINQILGRKWHALPREEQAKFYDMARKEKEHHQQMYPGWSARDNYAYHAKRRKTRFRYDNYEPSTGSASECYVVGDPSGMSKSSAHIKTSALNTIAGSAAYFRSPFGIGNLSYNSGNPNENFYESVDKAKPYFGLMNSSHHHQVCGLPRGLPGDTGFGAPNDPMAPAPESFAMEQHSINSPRLWLPFSHAHQSHSESQYDATEALSTASTSPWLHSQHPLDDHFSRKETLRRPLSPSQPSPSTEGPPDQGHFATPPYNPNGSFEYGFNAEAQSDQPVNYLVPQNPPPFPVTGGESEHPTKLEFSYEEAIRHFVHNQADNSNKIHQQEMSRMYGFKATTTSPTAPPTTTTTMTTPSV